MGGVQGVAVLEAKSFFSCVTRFAPNLGTRRFRQTGVLAFLVEWSRHVPDLHTRNTVLLATQVSRVAYVTSCRT